MEEQPSEEEMTRLAKFMYVTDDVCEAMFALHFRDPAKYHPRFLSRMFHMSLPRTHAILRIKHVEKRMLATRDLTPVFDVAAGSFYDFSKTRAERQNLYRAFQDPENKLHAERARVDAILHSVRTPHHI